MDTNFGVSFDLASASEYRVRMTCSLRVSSDVLASITAPFVQERVHVSVRCSLRPVDLQFDEVRASLRNPAEAQSDGWECRDLLGAGRAGYPHGVVGLNVGLQTAGKRHHIPSCNCWRDRL